MRVILASICRVSNGCPLARFATPIPFARSRCKALRTLAKRCHANNRSQLADPEIAAAVDTPPPGLRADEAPLSIPEAKRRLALIFGVPAANVEISVEG